MDLHSFALESLEGRAFLSVAAPLAAAPMMHAAESVTRRALTDSHPLAGAFNAAGTYKQPPGNPDTGPEYVFTGGGRKPSLGGKFKLTGTLHAPGFINNARSHGQFTITTSRGTITLAVHGPPQTPGIIPATLAYKIVKGTGAYTSSTGKGKIGVSASDSTHRFVFRFNPTT